MKDPLISVIVPVYNVQTYLGACVDSLLAQTYENIEITVFAEKITRKLLLELLTENTNNILLLNDNSQDSESSDSQTLLRLITLRDIANKTALHFSITTPPLRSLQKEKTFGKTNTSATRLFIFL